MAERNTYRRKRRRTLSERMSYQPTGRRGSESEGKTRLWLLLGMAAIIAYVVLFSPLFWVSNVAVSGTHTIDPTVLSSAVKEEATQSFAGAKTASLAVLDPIRVQNGLKQRFTDAASIQVTRQWPRTLKVEVTERESALIWESAGGRYLVDRQGIAYAKAEERTDLTRIVDATNLPVELGKPVVGGGFITVVEQVKAGLEKAAIGVDYFEIPESTFELRAYTKERWYALFDTARKPDSQIEALVAALKTGKPAQYIDLRVPGRVYVR